MEAREVAELALAVQAIFDYSLIRQTEKLVILSQYLAVLLLHLAG